MPHRHHALHLTSSATVLTTYNTHNDFSTIFSKKQGFFSWIKAADHTLCVSLKVPMTGRSGNRPPFAGHRTGWDRPAHWCAGWRIFEEGSLIRRFSGFQGLQFLFKSVNALLLFQLRQLFFQNFDALLLLLLWKFLNLLCFCQRGDKCTVRAQGMLTVAERE